MFDPRCGWCGECHSCNPGWDGSVDGVEIDRLMEEWYEAREACNPLPRHGQCPACGPAFTGSVVTRAVHIYRGIYQDERREDLCPSCLSRARQQLESSG